MGDEVKAEVMVLFVRLLGLVKGKEKIAKRLGGLFGGFKSRGLRERFFFFSIFLCLLFLFCFVYCVSFISFLIFQKIV